MKNLVIIGMKNSGKSTLAKKIAETYAMSRVKIDDEIEKLHTKKTGEVISFREIAKKHGMEYFLALEANIIKKLAESNVTNTVIDCSGQAPLREENRNMLKTLGPAIWLKVNPEINYNRLIQNGIPAFFKYPDAPKKSFNELWQKREPVYRQFADFIIEGEDETSDQLLEKVKSFIID